MPAVAVCPPLASFFFEVVEIMAYGALFRFRLLLLHVCVSNASDTEIRLFIALCSKIDMATLTFLQVNNIFFCSFFINYLLINLFIHEIIVLYIRLCNYYLLKTGWHQRAKFCIRMLSMTQIQNKNNITKQHCKTKLLS